MANESFVSVPPNVEDPTVLRRFLSRLVEQVDIAFGNRGGEADAYVDQQALITSATSLAEALAEAKELLEDAAADLENTQAITAEDYEARFAGIESNLSLINNVAAIKSAMLNFTVDAINDIVHNVNYNINEASSTRVSTGVYEFALSQETFYGVDAITNSTISSEHVIAPSAASELFDVSISPTTTAGVFRVSVSEFVVGAGSKLTIQPYDLLPGDLVTVTGLFSNPNSSLPPV